MSNPLQLLEREHEVIEREILELETILEEDTINYPNLIHVFKKFYNFWNNHEDKESKILEILEKEGYSMELNYISFYDESLREHAKSIASALKSKSEYNVKKSLEENGREIIQKVRNQIEQESWAFCVVNWGEINSRAIEAIQLIQVLPLDTETFDLLERDIQNPDNIKEGIKIKSEK